MKRISPQAQAALSGLLEAYPELRGLLAEAQTDRSGPPRGGTNVVDWYRAPAWVCFRRDRQTWCVRWTVPDATKPHWRRYRWRTFGKGDAAQADAEAFRKQLLPELARLWDELIAQRRGDFG